MDLLSGVLALAGLAVGIWFWLRASRPMRRCGAAERALDGALVVCWLGVVFFFLLAGLGVFRIWIAVGVWIVTGSVAAVIVGRRDSAGIRSSAQALRGPDLTDPFLWAALPLCLVALVRLVKSMAAPPMAWDAMTMHLPKAAFWIQSGSLALPDFPDAWTYYRWFPGGGEILFAWAMLPFRGDLLLGVFGFVVWLAIWIAGARLARELGASNRNAWLAGAAVAALPAVLVFMTANYVDNLVVLFVLLALTHAVAFVRTGDASSGVLATASAGLAMAVKTSSLVLVAPLILTIIWFGWGPRLRPRSRHPRPSSAWAAAMIAALGLPGLGYLWTWMRTGSPFYPVRAPGLALPYHQGLADIFSGRLFAPAVLTEPGWPGLVKLFYSAPAEGGHMNFGLGGAILALAGAAGFLYAARKGDRRIALALCLGGAALLIPLVLSPGNLALRTVWMGVLGRHLLAGLAPVALCAALLPGIIGRLALSASLIGSTLHFLPLGWSSSMTAPALRIAGAILVLSLASVALGRLSKKYLGPRRRWGFTALAAVLFLASWSSIREHARYPIYRETAQGLGAFDAHPIHPAFAMATSLWQLLDSADAKLLAVTVGPDQVGHNQFFYPLLGSRLQNRLIYVPTSDDPAELSWMARERYARAQPEVWLANLEAASVDRVIGLWQPTPERDWLTNQSSFKVTALTDLGVPWIGERLDP